MKKSNLDAAYVYLDSAHCDAESVKAGMREIDNVTVIDATAISTKEIAQSVICCDKNVISIILGGLEFTENVKNAIKSKMDRI